MIVLNITFLKPLNMIGFFLITTKFLSKVNVPKKTNLKLKVSFIKFDSPLSEQFFWTKFEN